MKNYRNITNIACFNRTKKPLYKQLKTCDRTYMTYATYHKPMVNPEFVNAIYNITGDITAELAA
jgi:hypothetical protein